MLALSAGAGARAAKTATLRFCFNEWKPYAYVEDGEARGVTIEITRLAAQRAGFGAGFTELPWNRCLDAVAKGVAMDAVLDAASRAEFKQGPTSANVYTNTFWVRENSPAKAFTKEVLAGRRIGLVHGYQYPDSLMADIDAAGMKVEYVKDDDANLHLLTAGRVDFIIGDYVSTHLIRQRQGLAIRPLRPDNSYDALYISFSPAAAAAQVRFDRALKAMLDDGTVARIYRERLGVELSDLRGES